MKVAEIEFTIGYSGRYIGADELAEIARNKWTLLEREREKEGFVHQIASHRWPSDVGANIESRHERRYLQHN